METKDLLISCLFARVQHHREPEDHPVFMVDLAKDCLLPLNQAGALCEELGRDGLLVVHSLQPPLVYLTLEGVVRARNLENKHFATTPS